MSKFEVHEDSVQYHDYDDDVLELVSGTDGGVLLTSGPDGVWVDSRDLREVVKYMANLSGIDGDFIEASGHEVETLTESYACGVGASRAVVSTAPVHTNPEVVEESARNLWAIAKVMRDEQDRKAEEEKKALPEVGTYVSLSKGTVTTYGFPVIFDEDTNIFVAGTASASWKVSVSGTASGKRRVYSVHPEAVTVIRPKVAVGDRVTVAANAMTYTEETTHFDGETTGTIISIHQFDATVLGYSHTHKTLIEQEVALDFLTPAEEPKVGDRVHVHAEAKTVAGNNVYFGRAVEGTVTAYHKYGPFEGDLYIETTDRRVNLGYREQFVAPKWVVVLPPEVPEIGDRVLVPKDATTALGHPVFTTKKDIVATVYSNVNFLGNIVVRTEDPFITTTYRQCVVDPKKVRVLEKAADIATARAEVLKHGTVKFEDLPKELQQFVDDEIERKKK